jgi:Uncharacterised nucleotidyltransferase/Transglutaminase-like superfamily
MNAPPIAATSAIAASNMWKMSRLGQVLDRSHRAGVPVLVLKGAALLGWLYRMDERPMADVDLLIRPNDRGIFLDALGSEAKLAKPSTKQGLVTGYAGGQFSVDFLGLPLDVHTHLLESPWLRQLVPINEAGLWARALPAVIAGRPALRLSIEDQLLHLAAHATFHHSDWRADHPHRVNDAVRLVRETSVAWGRLCELANAQAMRTATWLMLSNPALSPFVPLEVLASLRPGALGSMRVRLASRLAGTGDKSIGPVLLTDRNLGLLRAATTILTPSSEWLRLHYPHSASAPGRAARHYLKVGTYATRRIGRITSRRSPRPTAVSRHLGLHEKLALALRIWFWFLVVQLELRRRPLREVVVGLGTPSRPRRSIGPRRLGYMVTRTLHVGPYRPRCLLSALVHYRMLVEHGHRGELVIGLPRAARSKDAHAWIEIGGADVGPPPGRGDHLALAHYR